MSANPLRALEPLEEAGAIPFPSKGEPDGAGAGPGAGVPPADPCERAAGLVSGFGLSRRPDPGQEADHAAAAAEAPAIADILRKASPRELGEIRRRSKSALRSMKRLDCAAMALQRKRWGCGILHDTPESVRRELEEIAAQWPEGLPDDLEALEKIVEEGIPAVARELSEIVPHPRMEDSRVRHERRLREGRRFMLLPWLSAARIDHCLMELAWSAERKAREASRRGAGAARRQASPPPEAPVAEPERIGIIRGLPEGPAAERGHP